MKIFLAECDVCRDLCRIPEPDAKAAMDGAESDEPIVLARCAILRELDSGTEECRGDVVLLGTVDLRPILADSPAP
jgi:hypothetical protein